MTFEKFNELFQKHVENMQRNELFVCANDKDAMWNLYLDSFPEGSNETFRERREYDCTNCSKAIKNFGNVVAIVDNTMVTMWDIPGVSEPFASVAKAMSQHIKNCRITDVFFSSKHQIGVKSNYEFNGAQTVRWDHLYVTVNQKFIKSNPEKEASEARTDKAMLQRAITELTRESVEITLELILQGSMYKGNEWLYNIRKLLELMDMYEYSDNKDLFLWEYSANESRSLNRIRNSAIGTFLIDLSEGLNIDSALRKYESVVAPENYQRPKAVFTKKMVEEQKKILEDLGYINSLGRRFATADDISVNDILFVNRRVSSPEPDVFDILSDSLPVKAKEYAHVETVPVEKFIKDVLPSLSSVQLLLENRLNRNLVSLIAPKKSDSKSMFKWSNQFSWAYTGNIAASSIAKNVAKAGGNVNGVLRFSIQWNDGSKYDGNDLDAHAFEPNGNHIYFPNARTVHPSSASLDVDIITPSRGKAAVENIVWTDTNRMPDGQYELMVNCYSYNGGNGGFRAEIEFDGKLYQYDYTSVMTQKKNVVVAVVTYSKENGFTIKENLNSSLSSKSLWGVTSNKFIPVSVIMNSPNYWGDNNVGHKHIFFMLEGCKNEESPNGFFNEYLNNELKEHKRVLEALGESMKVSYSDDQLSGVGFSTTLRNHVLLKIVGTTERVIKVVF